MSTLHLLPSLQIELDQAPLSLTDSTALSSVRIQQRLSQPALCELTFADSAGTFGQEACWTLGNNITLKIADQPETLFQGNITALDYLYAPDGSRQLRVRSYDRLQRLRQSFSVGAYVQVTTADLARELVAAQGWTVEAPDAGPLWPRLIQYQQSDLDFLAHTAERSGLYLSLQDTVLRLLPLVGQQQPTDSAIPLRLGESLLEVRVALTPQVASLSVAVSGWDPFRAEPLVGSASQVTSGREISFQTPTELGLGDRTFHDTIVTDNRQADAIAQAQLNRHSAQAVTLWGIALGNSQLKPGSAIDIKGIAPHLEGRYHLTAVNHCIDTQQGFISEISTVPPPPQERTSACDKTAGYSTTLGTVTQLNDPDNLGRVQVALPTCNDTETEWLQVLAPGAGATKGLVALPDVGDRVLVLFVDHNPAQGVVLGGLYGANTDMDWGIESGRTQRQYWRSARGQQITYDDERQRLRLENSHGSYIDLLPDQVLLHSATDLTIEAPGHAVKICGQSIDFIQQS